MTREEAKDYIREWCPYDRQEEIIKVLEQEPCEDAISRQAVLDGIVIIAKAKAKSDAQKSLMGRVLFFTENLPSVTPQPKTDTLDKIRGEILEEKEYAYADFERYKVEYLGQDWEDVLDSLPQDDFRYGMERAVEIIDKYKAESEVKKE